MSEPRSLQLCALLRKYKLVESARLAREADLGNSRHSNAQTVELAAAADRSNASVFLKASESARSSSTAELTKADLLQFLKVGPQTVWEGLQQDSAMTVLESVSVAAVAKASKTEELIGLLLETRETRETAAKSRAGKMALILSSLFTIAVVIIAIPPYSFVVTAAPFWVSAVATLVLVPMFLSVGSVLGAKLGYGDYVETSSGLRYWILVPTLVGIVIEIPFYCFVFEIGNLTSPRGGMAGYLWYFLLPAIVIVAVTLRYMRPQSSDDINGES